MFYSYESLLHKWASEGHILNLANVCEKQKFDNESFIHSSKNELIKSFSDNDYPLMSLVTLLHTYEPEDLIIEEIAIDNELHLKVVNDYIDGNRYEIMAVLMEGAGRVEKSLKAL